jgi:hypothetical protein
MPRILEETHMSVVELDALIDRFLPQVLADPDLGDGLHLSRLWALSCLHIGECFDETLLAERVYEHLPSDMLIAREVGN